MAKLLTALLIALFAITGAASAATIYVDANASAGGNGSQASPYQTIQVAINATQNGDIVVVQPGTYAGGINFAGKNITVRGSDPASAAVIASTIIDGSNSSTVVTIGTGETSAAVLEGFTIANGLWSNSQQSGAGGIFIYNASPTIRNNVIVGNHSASEGGGIAVIGNSSPLIQNNTIRDNSCDGWGGGIVVYGETDSTGALISTASPVLLANLIEGNFAFWDGGGVAFFEGCTGTIQNCVIADNVAGEVGGGIFVGFDVQVTIISNTIAFNYAEGSSIVEASGTVNRVGYGGGVATWFSGATVVNSSIFVGNMAKDGLGNSISLEGDATLAVSYCNVPGGQPAIFVEATTPAPTLVYGPGNVDVNPLFASNDDFHLKSRAGRYDPALGTFVNDSVTSPLIDAADPTLPYSNEPSPNGARRNMGAYGNTLQASRTPLTQPILEITAARFDYAAGRMFFDLVMVDNGGLSNPIVSFSSGATISGAGAGNFMSISSFYRNRSADYMADALAPDAYAWAAFTDNTSTAGTGNFSAFAQTTDYSTPVLLSDIPAGAILARYYFYWNGSNIDEMLVDVAGYAQGDQLNFLQYDGGFTNSTATVANNGENIVRPLGINIDVAAWVYQNTAITTADAHRIPVTVAVTDDNDNGNTSYVVTVIKTGGAGDVTIDPSPGANPLVRTVIGGRRTDGVAGTGDVQLNVIVTGNKGGVAMTPATINVRKLGDVDGSGFVTTDDLGALNNKLNGTIVDVEPRACDVNGSGFVTTDDLGLLNSILNGATIN